jgi:hypothetical protein
MIEVTNIDTGDSVFYSGPKAKQMLEIYRGHHGLRVRYVDGRGREKPKTPMLRIVCRWCGKVVGQKPARGQPVGDTHTICRECLLAKIDEQTREDQKRKALEQYWISEEAWTS